MPVTLAQAAQNAQDDYDATVIDEFRTNPLMDLVTFDDVVNPAGGGATLTYGYRRVTTTTTADTRALNSEYTPGEAQTTQYSVDLTVMGGSYQIDRVLAKVGASASGEIAFQTAQKVKATKAKFGDLVINGEHSSNANEFDGLKKALTGSSTEDTTARNWNTAMSQAQAFAILGDLDTLIGYMDGEPGAIISNKLAINYIKQAMRYANQYAEKPMAIGGATYATYGNAILLDAGKVAGSGADVIPVAAKKVGVYAVRFGLDGFHGVATVGSNLVNTYLPDFTTAGAVKTGEVELGPIAMALKATKAAAVLTAVQVTA